MIYKYFLMVLLITGSLSMTTTPFKKGTQATELTGRVVKDQIKLTWSSMNGSREKYWEVQGSEDGKLFATIGMVMGINPATGKGYEFKQALRKLKPGLKYYRVLQVLPGDQAVASETIRIK